MPEEPIQVSAIKEQQYTQGLGSVILGVIMVVGGLILFYFTRFWVPKDYRVMSQIIMTVSILAGGGVISAGVNRLNPGLGTVLLGGVIIVAALNIFLSENFWLRPELYGVAIGLMIAMIVIGALVVRKGNEDIKADKAKPKVRYSCPYCEKDNLFIVAPTTDFDCDHCHRTVRFENGVPVVVNTITCTACRAVHRIPANVTRYLCDQCNRPLNLKEDKKGKRIVEVEDQMLQNYDVLLVAYDRRTESDLAFKLQNLMFVNLPEARRMLSEVGATTPLVVGYDLAERKADAVRRELQDLGGTARLRPTQAPK